MSNRSLSAVLAALSILTFQPGSGVVAVLAQDSTAALDRLTTVAEREFLLEQLEELQPPERLAELAAYGDRQSGLGGGFYGMLPDQLVDAASLPAPRDASSRVTVALWLARQRETNRNALRELNPDYPERFAGASLSGFLQQLSADEPRAPAANVHLDLDRSAIAGFFDALADGEVSQVEAESLAALPANLAMLQHRRDLGYVPEPLPDSTSLVVLIQMAGSPDPLDRLWCWVNPQNAFGYADLVQNADGYRVLATDLDTHGDRLLDAALARIAAYTPDGTEFSTTFAFTVGWAVRGWTTPEMAGLNLEQVKDDWPFLYGTLVEETYHRLQLQLLSPTPDRPAIDFAQLVAVDTGSEPMDRLYEIVAYSVAEGAANLVRGEFAPPGLAGKAPQGAELMERFVREVVVGGDVEHADELITEGLRNNGPLYGLGLRLASEIAEHEGSRAVGEWQRRGPLEFFLHGAVLGAAAGEPVLDPSVIDAVAGLRDRAMAMESIDD